MSIHLVKDVSDKLYPYSNHIVLGRPGNSFLRASIRHQFETMLRVIDVHDYKFVENNYGYDLLFKYHIDDVHHDAYFMEKMSEPHSLEYKTPASTSTKLQIYFNELAAKSDLSDKLNFALEPDTQFISVKAASLADYFKFWRQVPETRRLEFAHL